MFDYSWLILINPQLPWCHDVTPPHHHEVSHLCQRFTTCFQKPCGCTCAHTHLLPPPLLSPKLITCVDAFMFLFPQTGRSYYVIITSVLIYDFFSPQSNIIRNLIGDNNFIQMVHCIRESSGRREGGGSGEGGGSLPIISYFIKIVSLSFNKCLCTASCFMLESKPESKSS